MEKKVMIVAGESSEVDNGEITLVVI